MVNNQDKRFYGAQFQFGNVKIRITSKSFEELRVYVPMILESIQNAEPNVENTNELKSSIKLEKLLPQILPRFEPHNPNNTVRTKPKRRILRNVHVQPKKKPKQTVCKRKREDSFETILKMPQEKRLRVTTASRLDTKEEVRNIVTKTMQSPIDALGEKMQAMMHQQEIKQQQQQQQQQQQRQLQETKQQQFQQEMQQQFQQVMMVLAEQKQSKRKEPTTPKRKRQEKSQPEKSLRTNINTTPNRYNPSGEAEIVEDESTDNDINLEGEHDPMY
jgi:hypothetical protein